MSLCLNHVTILSSQDVLNIEKTMVLQSLSDKTDHYCSIAIQIWDNTELGFREDKSIELRIGELEQAEFTLKREVAGMPTAFISE